MNRFKFRSTIVVAAVLTVSSLLASIVGCGGGGGGGGGNDGGTGTTPPPALASTVGKIVDGYIIGATVCLDLNDDRIFQTTEPCVVTGADGSFAFPGQGLHMVRSVGGVDSSTNTPFIGELRAPPGATVITPLTTLVVADVESHLPTPVADTASALPASALTAAETAVKSNLGIPVTIALSTTDPVKAVKDNPADAGSIKLVQQTTAVQTLMQQTTKAVAAATGLSAPTAAQVLAIYKETTKSVATLAAAPASATSAINLSSTTTSFINTVVGNTVIQAKTSAEVLASLPPAQLTTLSALAPASVAAMATKTIADQVKAVSDSPAATLVAAAADSTAANNPALAAFKNTSLQVAISSAAPLLTTAVAAVNSPAVLGSLSDSIVSILNSGGGTGAAEASSIINDQMVVTSVAVPTANIALVNPTTIQATQATANGAVLTAISTAATTVASATTTTLAGATTTLATTTTTKAPTTTTTGATTTTTGATTTTAAASTTTTGPTTTTAAPTTTTATPTTTTTRASTTSTTTTTTTGPTTTTTAPTTTTTRASTTSTTTTTTTTATTTTTTAPPTTTTTRASTTSTTTTTTTTATTTTTTTGVVTVSLDGLNGTIAAPATYDGSSGGGRFNFTDSVATASYTRITNCGANDSVAITGGGSNHLIVANNGADVVLTVNAGGTVSQITLVGVTSASAIVGSLSALNALGLCTVTYN